MKSNMKKIIYIKIIGNKEILNDISKNLIEDSINYYNNKFFEIKNML